MGRRRLLELRPAALGADDRGEGDARDLPGVGQELGDDLAGADDRESQSASPIASRTTPSSGAVS